MSIREEFECREQSFMSRYGCLSTKSKGRASPEEPCLIRSPFQRDRDRIVYSNAFRRLKHKTQVFLSVVGDTYRTRLTHTLEVSEIARTIARAMRLNEDLAEAISLGHDLGHTPFGHSGEIALREIHSPSFTHKAQSLRVVERLENRGSGLNLTFEVRDGIVKHSKGYGAIMPDDPDELACTLEGQIVRIADIMAYLNHDLDDAVRSGVIREAQIPVSCCRSLGKSHSERAVTMMRDLIFTSRPEGDRMILRMSDPVYEAMSELRTFLYEHVYRAPRVHNEFLKAKKILSELYGYMMENENVLRQELANLEISESLIDEAPRGRIVCDLIASMTDHYALDLYSRLFFPLSGQPLNACAAMER
jgi:dGTPase